MRLKKFAKNFLMVAPFVLSTNVAIAQDGFLDGMIDGVSELVSDAVDAVVGEEKKINMDDVLATHSKKFSILRKLDGIDVNAYTTVLNNSELKSRNLTVEIIADENVECENTNTGEIAKIIEINDLNDIVKCRISDEAPETLFELAGKSAVEVKYHVHHDEFDRSAVEKALDIIEKSLEQNELKDEDIVAIEELELASEVKIDMSSQEMTLTNLGPEDVLVIRSSFGTRVAKEKSILGIKKKRAPVGPEGKIGPEGTGVKLEGNAHLALRDKDANAYELVCVRGDETVYKGGQRSRSIVQNSEAEETAVTCFVNDDVTDTSFKEGKLTIKALAFKRAELTEKIEAMRITERENLAVQQEALNAKNIMIASEAIESLSTSNIEYITSIYQAFAVRALEITSERASQKRAEIEAEIARAEAELEAKEEAIVNVGKEVIAEMTAEEQAKRAALNERQRREREIVTMELKRLKVETDLREADAFLGTSKSVNGHYVGVELVLEPVNVNGKAEYEIKSTRKKFMASFGKSVVPVYSNYIAEGVDYQGRIKTDINAEDAVTLTLKTCPSWEEKGRVGPAIAQALKNEGSLPVDADGVDKKLETNIYFTDADYKCKTTRYNKLQDRAERTGEYVFLSLINRVEDGKAYGEPHSILATWKTQKTEYSFQTRINSSTEHEFFLSGESVFDADETTVEGKAKGVISSMLFPIKNGTNDSSEGIFAQVEATEAQAAKEAAEAQAKIDAQIRIEYLIKLGEEADRLQKQMEADSVGTDELSAAELLKRQLKGESDGSGN